MEQTLTCSIELNKLTKRQVRILKETRIYLASVLSYLQDVVIKEEDTIFSLSNNKERLAFMERLLQRTKNNEAPAYPDFDTLFPQLPSYHRRALINKVLGHYTSFLSNERNWKEAHDLASSECRSFKKKKPALGSAKALAISFYQDAMYRMEGNRLFLKVRIRNTWDWIEFSLADRDVRYLEGCMLRGEIQSPALSKRYGKYYLDFPITYKTTLSNEPLLCRKALGVDLGINTPVVCSLIDASGTVYGRRFISLPAEKDRMERLINRAKRIRKASGQTAHLAKINTKINGIKLNYARQIASRTARTAKELHADVVVMEYLSDLKKSASNGEKLHHWMKRRIQEKIVDQCHLYGIRVAFVNPKNTSKLAFDGSGEVIRSAKNFSLCTFSNGKQYHCDLNASLNIAARYFHRELLKSVPERESWWVSAKVSNLIKRTNCTLSSYRELFKFYVNNF